MARSSKRINVHNRRTALRGGPAQAFERRCLIEGKTFHTAAGRTTRHHDPSIETDCDPRPAPDLARGNSAQGGVAHGGVAARFAGFRQS
jgi:hypothetical protein